MLKKRYPIAFAILLIGTLLLSACGGEKAGGDGGGSSSPSAGSGGAPSGPTAGSNAQLLRVGLDVDAGTLDPRLAKDTTAARAIELIYDGLVYLDSNLQPKPALAEDWTSPDPTTWIFNLRSGVKWHDGQDFTANDVVYTFTTLLDPEMKAPYASLYTAIDSVEAVDPLTVKFTLTNAYAPMFAYMDLAIVPAHIGEKDPAAVAENPVGTGAFKFVKWDKNAKIELTANENYWGGKPKLESIVLNVIPDNTNRANALLAGDIDLIHSPISPQDIPRLQGSDKLNFAQSAGLGFTYLNFNTSDSVIGDVNVRRAIASLVDRELIANSIYEGMDVPGRSVLLPSSWAYDESITGPQHEPAKAAELLTAAGYSLDGDKWKKNGEELKFVLSTHTEDPNRIQTVEFLQHVFAQNGITVTVETTEWATFSAEVQASKHQVALMGWLNLVDPDRAMYNQFHSTGGTNWSKYNNATVDQLLTDARAEMEQAKRAQLYKEAAKFVADDVVYQVVTYQGYIFAANKSVQGFDINPKGSFRSLQEVSLAN